MVPGAAQRGRDVSGSGSLRRVAFVTHYAALYGANRSLLALIRGLRDRGVEARVLAPRRGRITRALEAEGVPMRVVGFRPWRSTNRWKAPLRAVMNLLLLPLVVRQLREWRVDVVYTNSSVVPVGAWAAALLGLPHVWHVREFGREDYGLSHDLGVRFYRFWMRRSSAVIAVSEALGRRVADQAGEARVHVVYNGVIEREEARALRERAESDAAAETAAGDRRGGGDGPGGRERPYVFAIVGLLGGTKGQEEAIDGLALVRRRGHDARLWVVGSGPEGARRRLEERAASHGVGEAVEFRGFVSDPFEIYREADAVLVCSRSEAMGRVTAEAMLACRPVIGYRGGATPELVAEGETGLLYRGGPEELAQCMEQLASRPDRGRRMGLRGWRRAFPRLTVEAYADRIHRILVRVLDEPPAAAAAPADGRARA